MKHRRLDIDPSRAQKWQGSRIVKDVSKRIEEDTIKGEVTMNLVICDACNHVAGGIKYKFMTHSLYGSMSFFELKYVCVNCGKETILNKEELGLVNKYSMLSIDKVHFPGKVRTVIKRDAHVIGA